MQNGYGKLKQHARKLHRLQQWSKELEAAIQKDLATHFRLRGAAARLSERLGVDPGRMSEFVSGKRKVSNAVVQKLMEL